MPNESVAHEEKEKANVTKKEIREKEEGRERKDRSMGENDERPKDALDARLQVFDKTHSGRITIFDTLFGKMKAMRVYFCILIL